MGLSIGGIVSLGGGTGSGSGSSSGIQSINGQTGPSITITGTNGISVSAASNGINVNGAALSGLVSIAKFASAFTGITSGLFSHNLGTRDVIVNIWDNSSPPRKMIPDDVILDDLDHLSVLFNVPATGRIVILG